MKRALITQRDGKSIQPTKTRALQLIIIQGFVINDFVEPNKVEGSIRQLKRDEVSAGAFRFIARPCYALNKYDYGEI